MKIELREISQVKPYAKNPRINDQAVAAVVESLKEFGFRQPIVVDKKGVIVCGHTRYKAALELKLKKVPVHVAVDLTPRQIQAYRIADNKTGEIAEWDKDLLKVELDDLRGSGWDLRQLGFSSEDLEKLFADDLNPGLTDPDFVPDPPAAAVTQPGDVWILGQHRLLCGDSTRSEDVKRLMGGKRADICFTSPPYALGSSMQLREKGGSGKRKSPYQKCQDKSPEWYGLMDGWWKACSSSIGEAIIVNIQPLAGNKRDLFRWITERVDRLCDIVTWDKQHAAPAMGQGVLNSQFEWMLIFGGKGASRHVPLSEMEG